MPPAPNAYLTTLLRSLHVRSLSQDTQRLLSSSAYLLTLLSNPLNISLLTSQLLHAPAIWTGSIDLRFCLRIVNLFRSAAIEIVGHEEALNKKDSEHERAFAPESARRQEKLGEHTQLQKEEWLDAVVKGASGRDTAPPWKQTLVLAGLLIGFEGNGRGTLRGSARRTLVTALLTRINAAVLDASGHADVGAHTIALVLNYTWALLDERKKARLDWDHLLPILVGIAFLSDEGYRSGHFLAQVDDDVRQISMNQFGWSDQSRSCLQMASTTSQPLISSMGTFSRIIAYGVDHCRDPRIIQALIEDLNAFSSTLLDRWRRTKLSEVDRSDERVYFDQMTVGKTLPVLWKLLQSCLFAVVTILTSVVGRIPNERHLASDRVAPHLASQTLDILRSLYFIATRLGSTDAFSQLTFVHLATIDILSYHPPQASAFLTSIAPPIPPAQIPTDRPIHPIERTLALYFLNTAEHFTTILPSSVSSTLLLPVAIPYLSPPHQHHTQPTPLSQTDLDLMEASHSVILSILSSPQNSHLALNHLPTYITTLFAVFPSALSARQFTLAFKTLLRIVTTPAVAVAVTVASQASEEERWVAMAEALIELLIQRIADTPIGIPMPQRAAPVPVPASERVGQQPRNEIDDIHVSMLLTLISSLPLLPVPLLERYLPITAELIAAIPHREAEKLKMCREALWGVLSSGEMDVERSGFAVGWWGTRGGRDVVLGEGGDAGARGRYEMSGAIDSKL